MTNEQLINGLLAVKNGTGFDALRHLIQTKLDTIRDRLEHDPNLVDFNMICLLRGEAGAYRLLLDMFDRHLELIKKQQEVEGHNPDASGNF